jgi:death on curing protein
VRYLLLEEVLEIPDHQIKTYGGTHDVRDPGLLESDCHQPTASFSGQEQHQTLFEKAAAYAFFIINNHPFIDGNKRVGLHTALVFLSLNGIEIEISPDELYNQIIQMAQGKRSLKDFAGCLALHTS